MRVCACVRACVRVCDCIVLSMPAEQHAHLVSFYVCRLNSTEMASVITKVTMFSCSKRTSRLVSCPWVKANSCPFCAPSSQRTKPVIVKTRVQQRVSQDGICCVCFFFSSLQNSTKDCRRVKFRVCNLLLLLEEAVHLVEFM